MMAGPIFTIRLIAASLWPMNMVISSTGQQRLLTTRYSMRLWLISKAKKEKNIHPETSVLCRTDLIYFSAIPWIDYVSMTLPVITNPYGSGNQTYNIVPCVGWGKYVSEGDRCRMSMHMKISHAFIDGKPLADAFNNIQTALDELDF